MRLDWTVLVSDSKRGSVVEGKLKFSTKFAFGVGQAGGIVCSLLLSFVLLQPDLRTEPAFAGMAIGAALVLDGAGVVQGPFR